MAKILMLPFTQQIGTTNRILKIGIELRNLGHEVIFAGEGRYIDIVAKEGFPIYPLIEISHDFYLKHLAEAKLNYHTYESIKKFVDEELILYRKERPNVIVSEMRMTDSISSRIMGIPKISVTSTILTKYYKEKITIPETHFLHAVKKNLPFTAPLLDTSANILKDYYHKIWVNNYNKVAKDYNINGWKDLYEIMAGDYAILPDFSEFAPINKKRAKDNNIYQVGPIAHDVIKTLPEWYEKIDRKKKVIYCSLGSTGLHFAKIYELLFELYANDENYQIISNTTKLFNPEKFQTARNIFIAKLTPASKMMQVCDLVITHGGLGTIYHALENGRPIIGIPFQAEQEWNLDRIQKLNWGIKLSRKEISRDKLKNAINNVLNNKEIKENLKKVELEIRKLNGARDAAKTITRICN